MAGISAICAAVMLLLASETTRSNQTVAEIVREMSFVLSFFASPETLGKQPTKLPNPPKGVRALLGGLSDVFQDAVKFIKAVVADNELARALCCVVNADLGAEFF